MNFTRLCALVVAAVATSASAQIIQDSSLLFHYDAADINADGYPEAIPANARINQWNDKSGAGRNLQRASLVNGATNSYADNIFYLPNAANGMPALHFGNQVGGNAAGSVDYMLGPILSGTQLGGAAGDQMTMFMVQRKHANVVHAQWDATAQRLGFEGTARWDFVNGNTTAPAGQYAPTVTTAQAPLIQGGQFVVYTAERTGVTPPVGLVASTQYVYINGTQEQKIQTVTGLNLAGTNLARWGFGGQNSGGNLAHVDFAEVIYYNRQLSISERQQVESYLKKKYSIDTNSFAAGVYVNKAASVFHQYHGAYSISINGTGAEAADRLFDDAPLTKLLVASTAVTPINIDVMFPTDRIPTIASYNIASANDVPGRDPKNWTFQGSNNGTTWTTLDTRTNEAFATRLLMKTYALASAQTYRFYRLSITANNGDATNTQLSEWGFNTATTNTNPTVTGAAGGLSGTVAEVAANLFDRKTDTKYLPSSNAAIAVTVVMAAPETIRAYTVATANDVPGRDPRDFKLEGSNNGTTWTVLDSRTDIAWQARYQVREFNFTNSTAYAQYRFTVTKNWGEAATQASEVNLFPYSATTDSDGDGAADAREFQEFGNLTSVNAGDTDGDGLPDGYEFMNTSPRSTTALVAGADADSDGRTNLQEFTAGTLPLVADSDNDGLNDGAEFTAGTNPLVADSDGDGLSDGDEVNLSLTNPLAADSDLDGVSDAIERQLGYNPNSAASVPTFLPSIGINLAETNLELLQPYEVVGALGYRQANWNHLLPLNQTMAAGSVKDGSGSVVSGLSILSSSVGTGRARASDHSNAFKRLMNGFFTDSTTADNPTLTFTGIPYSNYDVVIYTESETTNALMGGFKIVDPNNAATVYGQNSYFRALNSNIANLDSSFVLIDQTGGSVGSPVAGNTIVFRNLTQANIKIVARALANNSRATISAVQIVATNPVLDTDSDGLPDSLEISLFGDLTSQSGATDSDGDGRTNAEEVSAGTSLMNTDSDGDGLSDSEEATNGTNPLLADTDNDGLTDLQEKYLTTNGLMADTDGDGVSDGREVILGSDPKVTASTPPSGLLFYEAFSNKLYGAGSIATQPLTSLYSPRSGTLVNGASDVVENSLTYGPIAVNGGRLRHSNLGATTTAELYTTLDVSGASAFAANGLVNSGYIGGGTTAQTVYVSFLYRSNRVARNAAGNLDGVGKSFFGFQTYRDTTEVTGMGESTASGTFGLFGPVVGDTPATPAFSTDNAVHLVVARIDFKSGANDDIKVWLDPNPLAAEAAQLSSVPTSVKTAITDLSFNRLAWRGSTVDTDHNIEYDEIRIGTSWAAVLPTVSSALVINEFSATGGLEDEDGSDEDWIEIYNGGGTAVDLSGYQLKDSTSTWLFPTLTPAVMIQPGQHLVVFASSKDVTKRPGYTSTSVLHTNFKLSAAGEYLALLDPANTVLSEFNPKFPVQQSGYTYGLKDGVYGYMQPTPRGSNSSSYASIPSTLTVSQNSGVFTAPFSVSITGQAPGQLVRYTLDGSIPSIGNGFTYAAPVTISSTAQFRCRVAQPGLEGPISSEVYLFPATGAQTDATASYTIPIVVVDTSGRTIQAGDGNTHEWPTQCSYVIYENVPPTGVSLANTPPTLFSRGQIGVRGKTSSGEVKKPYGVKFFQEENDDDKARSVFGLPSASSWVLYAPDSFDKSGLRNVLMYELSRQMGQWAPNTRLVELYVNTSGGSLTNASYQGLYVFMEKPDRSTERVNVEEITPYQNTGTDVTGGYIFQINKLYVTPPTDLRVGSGTYVPSTGADVLVEYPNEADTTVAQRTYLNNLLNEIEDTINANPGGAPTYIHPTTGLHYRDYIDVPSWVDHHILNVAANNVDGLRLSAKMYKPRNGKVFAGPVWDFDRSIDSNDGRDDNPLAWVGTSDATKFFRYGWWKAHNDPAGASTSPNGLAHGLLKDPDFMQTWVDRWKSIRAAGQPMTDANINAMLDAWQAQIFPAGATTATQCPANRNITKWASVNTPRTFPAIGLNTAGMYSNEVGVMKDWMQKHLAFIDGNIVKAPAFSAPSGVITDSTPITLSSADHSPGTTKLFFTIDGSDPRPAGGAAPVANGTTLFEYTAPFTLPTGHYVVKSRVFNPTLAAFDETVTTTKMSQWSGLSETYYFSDAAPAAAGNLVISELMYHPLDPSPAEITAGFTDSDQFEFIELLNVGATPIDLYESQFTTGIDYHFRNGTITQLAPGQRMLVVKNLAAFTMRYGATAAALVAGQFEGNDNLNNDGETITIVDRLGAVILSFTYDDIAPWPTDADGLGRSLVLKRPSTLSDHSLVTSWRASAVIGGEPGGVDSRSFLGIATNDTDGDGYSALLEYAAGTSDNNGASSPGFSWGVVADGAQNYLSVTFVADLRADDISITAQRSVDLAGAWANGIGDIIELSRIPNTATGFVTITFRSAVPYASTQAEFMRIQVTKP